MTIDASAPSDVRDVLARVPKAELHLHLEGAVDAATFTELARKHDVALPAHERPEDLYEYDTLADFLEVYGLVARSVRERDDFERITFECLARCRTSGARYVELFVSPAAHFDVGVEFSTVIAGVVDGVNAAADELGLPAAILPAINRELGPRHAVEFVELVQQHRCDEIIGIGLDYHEIGYPAHDYVEAFELAGRLGLHRTSHAAEVGPASNVRDGLAVLGCERIDHGYNVVDDPALLAECVDRAVPFTVCPTTTTFTSEFRDLTAPDHAIRQMADAGAMLTVNSDDPTMFGSDLLDEYVKLHEMAGFDLPTLGGFALNSLDAAWLDESTKRSWRSAWQAEIDALVGVEGNAQ